MVFAALVIVCGFPFKAIQLAFTPPYQQPDPFWQFSWPTFNQISWQHCFGGLIFQGAVGFILLIFYQIIMSCIVREIHPSLRLSTTCICTDNCAGCAAVSGEFMFFFLIAAVIAVGLYATVATTYTLLKTTTTYILTSIEDSVLEVKE